VASEAKSRYRDLRSWRVRLSMLSLCVVGMSTGIGCTSAPTRFAVDGLVTVDETPLDRGTIVFRAKEGEVPDSRLPIAEGRFAVPAEQGIPAGEYHVLIVKPEPELEEVTAAMSRGERSPLTGMNVPQRYSETGALAATIGPTSGRELQFELASD